MELTTVEFSHEHISSAQVQEFDCGKEAWAMAASDWIKQSPPFDCALQSIQKYKNKVWLHFIEAHGEKYLVGFSSLGITRWSIPPPDGEMREVGYIPMLAIAEPVQGKAIDDGTRRYSDAIFDHLIAGARAAGYRELCLFVHAENARALALYKRLGPFAHHWSKNSAGKFLRIAALIES